MRSQTAVFRTRQVFCPLEREDLRKCANFTTFKVLKQLILKWKRQNDSASDYEIPFGGALFF